MSKHDPKTMVLADLVELVRARMKRRRETNDPIYYTLHDAAVDEALLTEIGFLKLRAIESSGPKLADATNNPVPLTLSDAGSDAEGRDDG